MNYQGLNLIFLLCLIAFSIYGDAYNFGKDIEKCCENPGESPGWTNSIYQLSSVNTISQSKISTDSDCCAACVKNPNCNGWAFSQNECYLDVDKSPSPEICNPSTIDESSSQAPYESSGTIRCYEGCNLRRQHLW
ncbi:hypothetical protein C2G38_2178101 [Gigaspora rosea]|uniref:Apple domain-containing protein n=1 Tax=Gigaspora rosea TaxID=44941 RepID=A0A397VGI1_9GLOM|nr:hypothetical protein C2G38_2178101 [Gigaspora rosea]